MGAGELLRSNALRAESLFENVARPAEPTLFDQVEK